jgi:hypothetical protein
LRIIKEKGFNHPSTRIVWIAYGKNRPTESVFGHFRYEYEVKSLNGAGVIIDHSTHLMWQQSGSPDEIVRDRVSVYIAERNRRHHGGFADWRLPTIEELMSLIEVRADSNRLFIDPLFDGAQVNCINADMILLDPDLARSFIGVNFGVGGCSPTA